MEKITLRNDQITIVHGATPSYAPLTALTFPNHAEYAAKQGYMLKTVDFQPSEATWGKIRILREILNDTNIRRVFWIDADAIFTNMELALTEHLPDGKIVMACEVLGPNTGSMWLENCPEVHRLLWIIATRGHQMFATRAWHEQSAFRYFALHPPYDKVIQYVEQTRMNSGFTEHYKSWSRPQDGFGQWQPDHLILHLPGVRMKPAMEVLQKVLSSQKGEFCIKESENRDGPS